MSGRPDSPRRRPRALLLIPAVAAGIALAAWLVSGREPPVRTTSEPPAQPARVVTVPVLALRPRATGFGSVRPGETWSAVARVPGTVVYKHPDLKSGTILAAGARLLEIDPTDYRLAVVEAEVEIQALRADRDQLAIEEENTAASLTIERERLQLAERELARIRTLARQGTATAAQLDEQEKATLQQRLAVQSLENQLRLVPARLRRLDAEIERAGSRLARARKDLTDTVLAAPMDLRPADVLVDEQQFVATGQLLFTADSVTTAEVAAQVPIEAMRRLVGSVLGEDPPLTVNLAERLDAAAIQVTVELVSGGGAQWTGRVTRVESGLDPRTRTAQVVVEVADPYLGADPPARPPLVKNMYVRVHFLGRPMAPRVILPAAAVHEGRVYVLGSGDALEIRPIRVAFRQNGLVAVESGLAGGERVVVDDLVPAVEGMRIAPQSDERLEAWLAAEAAGTVPETFP